MSDISQIDGQSVRRTREALGLAVQDLATMACLSAKQIRQIEEGGMAAFYSENVKLTAARKVAGLLQMSEAQLFGQVTPQQIESGVQVLEPEQVEGNDPEHATAPEPHSLFASIPASPTTTESAALLRSESWHVLAQPPEDVGSHASEASPALSESATDSHSAAPKALEDTVHEVHATDTPAEEPPQSQTHFLVKVLALFLVALAAAALLKQQSPDEKPASAVSEPPPPLMANPPVGNEDNATPSGATAPTTSDGPSAGNPSAATTPAVPTATDKGHSATPTPSANGSADSHPEADKKTSRP